VVQIFIVSTYVATFNRYGCRAIDQDRMLALFKKKDRMLGGMSRDGNRPTDQYMACAARRWIP
jgi:hypothetical protein